MNNLRKKIPAILVLITLIFSGNFSYALTHIDCLIDNGIAHHKCEMECCKESDCCGEEEPALPGELIASDENNCCTVHFDQAVQHDDAILIAAKTSDNIKTDVLKADDGLASIYSSEYFKVITHRFKTTNIYLTVSNLRI